MKTKISRFTRTATTFRRFPYNSPTSYFNFKNTFVFLTNYYFVGFTLFVVYGLHINIYYSGKTIYGRVVSIAYFMCSERQNNN